MTAALGQSLLAIASAGFAAGIAGLIGYMLGRNMLRAQAWESPSGERDLRTW